MHGSRWRHRLRLFDLREFRVGLWQYVCGRRWRRCGRRLDGRNAGYSLCRRFCGCGHCRRRWRRCNYRLRRGRRRFYWLLWRSRRQGNRRFGCQRCCGGRLCGGRCCRFLFFFEEGLDAVRPAFFGFVSSRRSGRRLDSGRRRWRLNDGSGRYFRFHRFRRCGRRSDLLRRFHYCGCGGWNGCFFHGSGFFSVLFFFRFYFFLRRGRFNCGRRRRFNCRCGLRRRFHRYGRRRWCDDRLRCGRRRWCRQLCRRRGDMDRLRRFYGLRRRGRCWRRRGRFHFFRRQCGNRRHDRLLEFGSRRLHCGRDNGGGRRRWRCGRLNGLGGRKHGRGDMRCFRFLHHRFRHGGRRRDRCFYGLAFLCRRCGNGRLRRCGLFHRRFFDRFFLRLLFGRGSACFGFCFRLRFGGYFRCYGGGVHGSSGLRQLVTFGAFLPYQRLARGGGNGARRAQLVQRIQMNFHRGLRRCAQADSRMSGAGAKQQACRAGGEQGGEGEGFILHSGGL